MSVLDLQGEAAYYGPIDREKDGVNFLTMD